MILIYAFSNHWGTNISRRVLSALEPRLSPLLSKRGIGGDFLPVFFFPQSFFHKYIENNQYYLIIGLGDGMKFLTKIKIETQAKNAYNDKEIYPFSLIFLDLNMPSVDIYDSNFFKIGDNMGTYNCNWIAYKTQLNIDQKSLNTKHLFLHLPPKQNPTLIADQIIQLLTDNYVLV